MTRSNKMVSFILLLLLGLIVAIWGAVWIYLKRQEMANLATLLKDGSITQEQYNSLAPGWGFWTLAITQIVVGIILIVWGIYQYFRDINTDVAAAKELAAKFSRRAIEVSDNKRQ